MGTGVVSEDALDQSAVKVAELFMIPSMCEVYEFAHYFRIQVVRIIFKGVAWSRTVIVLPHDQYLQLQPGGIFPVQFAVSGQWQ